MALAFPWLFAIAFPHNKAKDLLLSLLEVLSQLSLNSLAQRLNFNVRCVSLILFTIAVVAIALSDQSTALTQTCAWVYLLARVLYVPAYAFDWVPWRSVIWGAGFFATLVMLIAALV